MRSGKMGLCMCVWRGGMTVNRHRWRGRERRGVGERAVSGERERNG